jgi:hypothetical protein
MATGYRAGVGGSDLDLLFASRVSAAAADVGYKNSGGVDLSQLFEPIGATTPRANVNYRNSSGTDLSAIFKDITNTPAIITLTMVAGRGTADTGFRNTSDGYSAYGTQSITPTPEWTKNSNLFRLGEFSNSDASGGFIGLMIRVSHATTTPADADTTWQVITCSGVYGQGGGTKKLTFVRSARGASVTGTTPNSRPTRNFQFTFATTDANRPEFVSGNTYTITIA